MIHYIWIPNDSIVVDPRAPHFWTTANVQKQKQGQRKAEWPFQQRLCPSLADRKSCCLPISSHFWMYYNGVKCLPDPWLIHRMTPTKGGLDHFPLSVEAQLPVSSNMGTWLRNPRSMAIEMGNSSGYGSKLMTWGTTDLRWFKSRFSMNHPNPNL